jgi:hypothetical protein
MNTTTQLKTAATLNTLGHDAARAPAAPKASRRTRLSSALAGLSVAVLLCGTVATSFQQQGEDALLAAQTSALSRG